MQGWWGERGRVPGGLAFGSVTFLMLPGYPKLPELIFAHQGQTSLRYASALISAFLTVTTIAIESPGFNTGRTPLLSRVREVTSTRSGLRPYQNITNFPILARRPGACLPVPTPASGEVASSPQQCSPANCLTSWPNRLTCS